MPEAWPTGQSTARRGARSSLAVRVSVLAVVVVLVAELVVRSRSGSLPEPLTWYHPSAQVKVEQMAAMARDGRRAEVVVAGTSQMAMGIDPAELAARLPNHPSTYNAAVLAGYPEVNRRFLPEEVLPRLVPEVVVFGVSGTDLWIDEHPPYDSSLATSRSPLAGLERWVGRWSALVRYRSVLREPDLWTALVTGDASGQIELYREAVIGQAGAWEHPRGDTCWDDATSPDADVGVEVPPPSAEATSRAARREDEVWDTVEQMEAAGVKVAIVLPPASDCWFASTPGGAEGFAADRARLRDGAISHGAAWIDVTDELRDGGLYHDLGHLNEEGSRRFTDLVADQLVAQGVVPP